MKRILLPLLMLTAGCKANLDLEASRSYPCNRSLADLDGAPQCPEGMHCGLDDAEGRGRCRLRGGGVAWRCEQGKDDCDPGWECGLNGLCRKADVVQYSCNLDRDCDPGFICGLERECRDASVNAAYQCIEDSHCVPSWRCGVEGRCMDPATQALDPQAAHGALLAGTVLSPSGETRLPDAVAAAKQGETWTLARVWGRSLQQLEVALASDLQNARSAVKHHELPEKTLRALYVSNGRTGLLYPDGLWRFDGTSLEQVASDLGFAEHLRCADTACDAWVAYSGSQYAIGIEQASGSPTRRALAIDGTLVGSIDGVDPAPAIREMAFVKASVSGSAVSGLLFANTTAGLFVRELENPQDGASPWQPIGIRFLANTHCPADTWSGPKLDIRLMKDERLALRQLLMVLTDGQGASYLAKIHESGTLTGPVCGEQGGTYQLSATPCPVCEGGEVVDVLTGLWSPELTYFNAVRCRHGSGAESRESSFAVVSGYGQECATVPLSDPVTATTLPSSSTPYAGLLHFEGGKVRPAWIQEAGSQSTSVPELLPGGALGSFFGPRGYAVLGSGASVRHAWLQEGVGFLGYAPTKGEALYLPVTSSEGLALRSGTKEMSSQVLLSVPDGPLLTLAKLGSALPVSGSYTAHLARVPDGGTQLVVTAQDLVLAADVSAVLAGQPVEPPNLVVRLSPSPQIPIRSAVVLPLTAPPAPGLLSGYALTDNDLFFYRAASAQRWESQRLPAPDGDWLEVFVAGDVARIGYRDGRVYALPTRLQLSAAAPVPMEDFEHVCGRTYAVGRAGLFRLEPVAGAAAEWVKETELLGLLPPGMASDFGSGSRLVKQGNSLVVATGRGYVIRLPAGPTCP